MLTVDESARPAPQDRRERAVTVHRQVRIAWGVEDADVDEDIVDLILACWWNDIHTSMSCQDSPVEREGASRRVWVEFPAFDAERFLSIVADRCEDDVQNVDHQSVGDWTDEEWESYQRDTAWWFDASLSSLAAPLDGEGERRGRLRHVSVRFPFADLDEVVRRLIDAYRASS
jgi:hypothetical protein